MDPKDTINTGKEIENLNLIKPNNKFINIKSDYFMRKLFGIMQKRISLKIIKYNINIQKRMNININNYKDALLILRKKIKNIFIYILMIIMKKLKKQN